MKSKYKTVVFKSYENGYYTFSLSNRADMVFEEVHPQILLKYDLKNDKYFRDKKYHLAFKEKSENNKDGDFIFRIEYLELINSN